MSPEYTSEVFRRSYRRHNTRASTLMLDLPFRKCCSGQKTVPYLGPRTWNTLPAQIKLRRSVNTFKHDIKKLFLNKLQKDTNAMFIYYYPKQPPIFNFYVVHGVSALKFVQEKFLNIMFECGNVYLLLPKTTSYF